jgi:anaerobic ribonucleoside-triphosphate reductase
MSPTVLVRKKKETIKDATHIALMVSSLSQEEYVPFDESKIVDELMQELDMSQEEAKKVAQATSNKIAVVNEVLKLKSIDTTFIRNFANIVLIELGFNKELKSRKEYTITHNDLRSLIENANTENGNTEHNPESINLTIAENVQKHFTLGSVFSSEVSKAHLEGKIHIHDVGYLRAYCSGHSIEYLKLNGIRNIPNILSTSKPAGKATTLARHLCSMTQYYTSLFAGAIGWEGVNIFFAPLLRNMSDEDVYELAQTLIFDLSQLAGAKGGQTSFTDFNVYVTIPEHYRETYAVFEKGKFACGEFGDSKHEHINEDSIQFFDTRVECDEFVSKTKNYFILKYKHFEKDAQRFLIQILKVSEKGDATGLPFAFPKINMHINEDCFTYEKEEKRIKRSDNDPIIQILKKSASVAEASKGVPYFIFDRNAMSIAQCCRLQVQFSEEDKKLVSTPEELRFVGVQNVSINLPNCALQAKKDNDKFYKELEHRMRLAIKAHLQKTKYLEHLVNLSNSPLKFYKKGMDGKPYVNFKNGSYLIGLVGLNECVYNLTGQEMHESKDAYVRSLEIVSWMSKKAKELSKEFNMNVKLEESPAESTASRFALLDKRKYNNAFVQENEEGIYYTNSVHFNYKCDMDYVDRLIKQSRMHKFIEAGAMIHLWCGDHLPSANAVYDLLYKTWYETDCVQWVLSPEYTICYDCQKTYTGFFDKCPKCESDNVEGVTRIVGYYIKTSKATRGKKAEILDRNHKAYILK